VTSNVGGWVSRADEKYGYSAGFGQQAGVPDYAVNPDGPYASGPREHHKPVTVNGTDVGTGHDANLASPTVTGIPYDGEILTVVGQDAAIVGALTALFMGWFNA
jgi:hypothetical protein